jgi:hypothetical protein
VGHIFYEQSGLCSRSLLSAGRHNNPRYDFDWVCRCIVNVANITRLQSAMRQIISEIGKEMSQNLKITSWKIKAKYFSHFFPVIYIYIYILDSYSIVVIRPVNLTSTQPTTQLRLLVCTVPT